jgi:thioredoxin-like negative regulator of GroEL
MALNWDKYRPWFAALPAVFILVGFFAVLGRAAWVSDKTDLKYRTLARQVMAEGDYDSARIYYSRLVAGDRPVDPQDELNWAQILARGGDIQSASNVMDRLAPDDGYGLAEAHRFKANQLARRLAAINAEPGGSEQLEPTLERLRHHISRSGNQNPLELNDLWVSYYWAAGQQDEALKKIVESAQYDPRRWLQAAVVSGQRGDQLSRDRYLAEAGKYFKGVLDENPLDHQSRIALAKVMVDTRRVDEASTVLDDGLKLSERPELRRAASDLRLYRMQNVKSPLEEGFAEFNRLLAEAMDLDPVNPAAYGRLMEVYQRAQSQEQRSELRARLERQIARGDSIAFAHFSLGGILWLEGDSENSLWHTEKAFTLNPDLLDVANNLAWLISEQESADLDRALELIEIAVQRKPDNFNYRDTKGTILMKMERWEEALTEFETILPRSGGEARKKLHERLATIYEALGKTSLAAMHREEAGEPQ